MVTLVDLHKHCYKLSALLQSIPDGLETPIGDYEDWLNTGDWLRIAAGVQKVEIDTARFDYTVMYCHEAWQHEVERSDLMAHFAGELATFTFVWGSLEVFIKRIVVPSSVPDHVWRKAGWIERAVYYLKTRGSIHTTVPLYQSTLAELRFHIHRHNVFAKYEAAFRLEPFFDISGLGLHVVRLIRNEFAHGSATLPVPSLSDAPSYGNEELQHTSVLSASTRIVLLTMQMLLLAIMDTGHVNLSTEWQEEMLEFEEEEDLYVFIRSLHLNKEQPIDQQMKFLM